MLELLIGVLLAAGAIFFILGPIIRPEFGGSGTRDEGRGDERGDPEDDFSARAVALRALREIEFDRATGKLSDADYDALKRKHTVEALAALRSEGDTPGGPATAGARRAAGAGLPRAPTPAAACPAHGPRPESDAQFCAECGRRLATAPGYCARCGTSLEREAKYCHACGARVAA